MTKFNPKYLISLYLSVIVFTVAYNYFTPPKIPDTMRDLIAGKTQTTFLTKSSLLNNKESLKEIADFIHASGVLESIVINLTSNDVKFEENSLNQEDITNYYNYLVNVSQQLKNFNTSSTFEDEQILLLKHNIVRLYSLIGTPQFIEVLKSYHLNLKNENFQDLINEQKSDELWQKYFSEKFGTNPYLQVYVQDSSYLKNISNEIVQTINSNIK